MRPVYISNRLCWIEQKLNWNVTQAWEKPYTIGILSYTDTWCLVPFSISISCTVWLCFLYHNQQQRNVRVLHDISSQQRGTERGIQQENSATKLVDICRSSCKSSAWQSGWGLILEFVDTERQEWTSMAKYFFRRKWRGSVTEQKNKQKIVTGCPETCYSWGPCLHNWVKWQER